MLLHLCSCTRSTAAHIKLLSLHLLFKSVAYKQLPLPVSQCGTTSTTQPSSSQQAAHGALPCSCHAGCAAVPTACLLHKYNSFSTATTLLQCMTAATAAQRKKGLYSCTKTHIMGDTLCPVVTLGKPITENRQMRRTRSLPRAGCEMTLYRQAETDLSPGRAEHTPNGE